MIGLGLLATGSGASFTSAAFSSSTTPTADLRVVVDQELRVQRGPGFNTSDNDNTGTPGFFTNDNDAAGGNLNETSSGAFNGNSDGESPPLAFVNGSTNENLVFKAAVEGGTTHTFEELLEITNQTAEAVNVGIAYDRGSGPGSDNSQYGQDISDDNVDVGPLNYTDEEDFAQNVYEFRANQIGSSGSFSSVGSSDFANSTTPPNNVISPDPRVPSASTVGVEGDSSNTISNDPDLPAGAVNIPAGEKLTIDLVVNTNDSEAIKAAAPGSNAFGSSTSTVNILDAITVGTFKTPLTENNNV